MALGVIPAVHVGHGFLPEAFLVFGAVEVGVDLRIHALLLQQGEVVQHFCFVVGRPA